MTALGVVSLVIHFCGPSAHGQGPVIVKIDPPNWWVGLTNPTLLIRGENLQGATFTLHGTSGSIKKIETSQNGHWAFAQLSVDSAVAGSFEIEARNSSGATRWTYTLTSRRPLSEQPRGFSDSDVIYLIMTDRFADGDKSNDRQPGMPYDRKAPHAWHGGDLRGIQQHLDYLKDLGVTTVWITPVYQNREADSYHGYGATDMYSVDDHFGSLEDLKSLAGQLHAQGMKLVLDIVPNHVGPAHPWVSDSPTNHWFHGTKEHHRIAKDDFAALLDPNASERARRDVLEGWFAGLLPDMNQENPLVAQYLIQNTIWWVESTGADGLRIDTFPYVGREFWRDFHEQLTQLYPNLTDVGEVLNSYAFLPPVVNAYFAGGVTQSGRTAAVDTGLYTPFDYPLCAVLRNVLIHDAPMSDLSLLLGQDTLYPHPERLATLFGSHDIPRFLGEEGATLDELRLGFALLFTLRGMPVVYSGDEIAMKGGGDPDNRRDFPGGFPVEGEDKDHNAFVASGRDRDQAQIHDWVKRLLAVRKQNPGLQDGQQQIVEADHDTLGYVRGRNLQHGCSVSENRTLIIANKSNESKTVRINLAETALAGCSKFEVLVGDESIQLSSGALVAPVGPHDVMIVRLQ